MSLSLYKTFASGMLDYITRHNANYTLIEDFCNALAGMLPGANPSALAVPRGLQEIFDRTGLIGDGAYDFAEGVLGSPYNLSVAAGAYWNGVDFLYKNTSTNVSLGGLSTDTYYLYLDSSGVPGVNAAPQTNTIYEFGWDSSTKTVSNKAVYTGVAILLDGDDYADCLTSTARSATYTRVADRLEAIELLLNEMGGFYAEDAANHDGLDFAYTAGQVRNDSAIYDTAADVVTLTDDATNYIEVDPTDGTVSANDTSFTSGQVPLFEVVTASGAISVVSDKRTWAIYGAGGGGGGHTQNTDTGTTGTTFTLDSDATGSPTGRVQVIVENGDDDNAIVAFNRDTSEWEYSVDGGSTWTPFGEFSGTEGAEVTQYIAKEDPDLVLEDLARGASADYEDLDVSAYVTAPDGLQAVALLVYLWDDDDNSSSIRFRKKGSAAVPIEGFTVWAGQTDPGLRLIPVDANNELQFYLDAGAGVTANLRLYLLGYYKIVSAVGPEGDQGDPGDPGADGKTILNGAVDPTTEGVDGDFYLNTTSSTLFGPKASGAWPAGVSLVGPEGDTGPQGDPGQTIDVTKEFSSITVAAADSESVNKTGFITRGLAHYLKVAETGGDVDGTYDIEIYDDDTFTTMIYQATGIDPATDYEDWLPWMFIDEDASDELHVKIINDDATYAGTYVITIRAEQFV